MSVYCCARGSREAESHFILAAQQQKTGGAATTFGDEHCESTEGRIFLFGFF
jgi:hypothetical protein